MRKLLAAVAVLLVAVIAVSHHVRAGSPSSTYSGTFGCQSSVVSSGLSFGSAWVVRPNGAGDYNGGNASTIYFVSPPANVCLCQFTLDTANSSYSLSAGSQAVGTETLVWNGGACSPDPPATSCTYPGGGTITDTLNTVLDAKGDHTLFTEDNDMSAPGFGSGQCIK